MIADADAIRSEPFILIGMVIDRDAELIVDRWQECAVAEQPNAHRLHHAALRDHLPDLLHGLAESLAAARTDNGNGHRPAADRHGRDRWEDGWSLDEVVRNFQIMRRVLLEHLDATLDRPLHVRECLAVGLSLDEAIADSVGRYVRHREAAVREQEHGEADRLRLYASELATAERHKDEFLAVLGHELRNPLAPLRNAVQLLRQRPDTATAAWAGDLMERQLRHLTRLVDDLLDTSRLARGKIALRQDRVDLAGLVRTSVADRRPLFAEAGRDLTLESPATPVSIRGDADRLSQVLDNLLANAFKFTSSGGRTSVCLTADPSTGRAIITVQDTGIGISSDLLPTIFQRYRQAHVDPERTNGGLGLGLALAKGLVELHGGTVTAASPGAGSGTTITVVLPVDPNSVAVDSRGRNGRVLVIEDNRDAADSLVVLLRLFGFDVRVAYSGSDGIAAAQADPPDVILCDLGLPGLDGFAVAAALRPDPLTARVTMIAVSGHGSDADRHRSAEAGFVRHVLKPVEPDEVRSILAELTKVE